MKQGTFQLVQKAVQGDHDAFNQLCRLYSKDILYICTKVMGNIADGEDASQEVFIRMQKSIRSLRKPDSFTVWMNRIIQSACLNQKRSARKEGGNLPLDEHSDRFLEEQPEFLPEQYAENSEDRQRLISCIDKLKPQYRQVIMLYYYEELSLVQMAEVLGSSKATVDHRLRRARDKIKRELLGAKEPADVNSFAVPVITMALQRDAETLGFAQRGLAVLEASGVFAGALGLPVATKGLISFAAVAFTGLIAGAVLVSGGAPSYGAGAASQATAPTPMPGTSVAEPFSAAPQPTESGARAAEELPAAPVADGYITSGSDFGHSMAEAGPSAGSSSAPPGAAPAAGTSRSTSSAPPPELPVSSPAAVEQPGAAQTIVSGRLALQTAAGGTDSGFGQFATGCSVRIWNADGRLLHTAAVQPNGTFVFEELYLSASGTYTLQAEVPPLLGLAFAGANPDGATSVFLVPGSTPEEQPVLYLTDVEAPSLGIAFTGADGTRTVVNPVSADIHLSDNVGAACHWEILAVGGSQPLFEGDGMAVTEPFARLLAKGRYQLVATGRDEAGNQATIAKEFTII